MKKSKQQRNRQRHDFLLTLFPDGSEYTEKEMNGFWLVKYFSNGTNKWEVSIFTKESFKRYKEYNDYKKSLSGNLPIAGQTTIFKNSVDGEARGMNHLNGVFPEEAKADRE